LLPPCQHAHFFFYAHSLHTHIPSLAFYFSGFAHSSFNFYFLFLGFFLKLFIVTLFSCFFYVQVCCFFKCLVNFAFFFNTKFFVLFLFFSCFCWPRLPRQGYCAYIHYRV
jgi:hypothetical protein